MLPIEDPTWDQLPSNYGTGKTVAGLLSQAKEGAPLHKWYDDLFQELLHQFTLSQAAYAAVPHLVDIARERPEARLSLLVLIGFCYAHSYDPEAPEVPTHLQQAWGLAQKDALPLLLEVLQNPQLNENEIRYLLAALAALKGEHKLSLAIEASDGEIQCPHCGAWIEMD